MDLFLPGDQVQVSDDGSTVWVHALDGSTVGRFSKRFGIDVHSTTSQQMDGAPQCLHCTHVAPSAKDWRIFCELMHQHYKVDVDPSLIKI